MPKKDEHQPHHTAFQTFRRSILRGLALVLPPLLTVVILIWVANTIQRYILVPIERAARTSITWAIADIRPEIPGADPEDQTAQIGEKHFHRTENGQWIPWKVYNSVDSSLLHRDERMPASGGEIYERYVQENFLQREFTIPLAIMVFVLILFLAGRFVNVGMGRILWNTSEREILNRIPVIRNVYSSVKQVTDFLLSEREVQFTRVVAVEYPRKGIWSLGFVTSESMLDIHEAAGEPVLTVLVPTSPMPATGFTISVRKSETLELNITLDQALQFIVSCGVVVPAHQQTGSREVAVEIAEAVARHDAELAEAKSGPSSKLGG